MSSKEKQRNKSASSSSSPERKEKSAKKAYGMYPGVCYAMLALLSGLNVLAKFASQPRSFRSAGFVCKTFDP